MKNTFRLFKTQLTLAVVLFCASIGFAQVVAVPSGCTVVLAGAGGTVGTSTSLPPGRVGNGGVVIMADPSGGGSFTFSGTTATTASWLLRGDISNTAVSPSAVNNAPPQPVPGLTANIFTCNKSLRTNSSETANPSWGRSKGQVRVSWTVAPCNNSITFDIFKTFATIPSIVGPRCLEPNKVYTYSIDQVASDNANDNIGFDKYYWSGLPAGAVNSYFSADNSSITFTTASGPVPALSTLKCCIGRYNTTANADGGNGPNLTLLPANYLTCTTLDLIPLTTGPSYVTAPPSCHPTGAVSFNVVYPNIPATTPVTTYTWAAPNTGWTVGAPVVGATSTTVTVTTPNNNPGLLSLIINGICQTVSVNYQIDRNLVAPSLSIVASSPTTSTCINSGGSGNYTISPNASANPIIWTTLPAVITGVSLSNATTSTVTVNVAANTVVSSFSLVASSSIALCNPISSISTTIYVRPATPTITGPTPACIVRGTTTTTAISCNAVTGATGYSWDLTGAPGWSISANGTTVNPTFIPNDTTAGSAIIKVKALGVTGVSCDSNVSANYTVNYSPVAPAIAAITCWNISSPMPAFIDLPITNFQNFGTYAVTSNPSLFSGTSSVVGSSIRLNNPVLLNTGSYTLVVTHTNGSCTAGTTNYTVATTAATPLSTVVYAGAGTFADNYNLSLATGETFVAFQVNNVTVTNSGTVSIFVGPTSGQLSLAGAPLAPGSTVSAIVSVGGCLKRIFSPTIGTRGNARQAAPGSISPSQTIADIKIYPNL
jgi:hypothetical protein